jgi:hypothetical protein
MLATQKHPPPGEEPVLLPAGQMRPWSKNPQTVPNLQQNVTNDHPNNLDIIKSLEKSI